VRDAQIERDTGDRHEHDDDRDPGQPAIVEEPDPADREGGGVAHRIGRRDHDHGWPRGDVDRCHEASILVDRHWLAADRDVGVGRGSALDQRP
jgi:hypothetical protein